MAGSGSCVWQFTQVSAKTKPEIAVEMLEEIARSGKIPFRYVTADSVYGNHPGFRNAVEAIPDVTYMVSIPGNTQCWLRRPVTETKHYKHGKEQKSKLVLKTSEKEPITFEEYGKNLNPFFWYRRKVSEGTKGPIEYEFTKRLIVLAKGGLPKESVWLIIRRTVGDNPIYSYYISNAMVSTRMKVFVWEKKHTSVKPQREPFTNNPYRLSIQMIKNIFSDVAASY